MLTLYLEFLCRIPLNERSESLSVPIHLSGVQCDGSERGILNCSNSSIIPSSHVRDAYVVCRPQTRRYSGITFMLPVRQIL